MAQTGRIIRISVVVALAALVSSSLAYADGERRVATLAPAGSAWMNILEEGAAKLREATQGRVKIKFYPGGVQGDEKDVVRKMKLKQLDGAALTSVGLAQIYPGIRVLQLPFLFDTVEEIDYSRKKMWPYFRKKFAERGFQILSGGDVGWVHLYSDRPVRSVEDLRQVKMWVWTDDAIAKTYFANMKINAVPLGVPDVLPALKTGRIKGCYGSPLIAVAMQWYTEVRYATSHPVIYTIGASVLRNEVWEALSPADKKAETEVKNLIGRRLIKRVRKDNQRAMKALKKAGIEVIETPKPLIEQLRKSAESTWPDLIGEVYSQEELNMVLKYRDEYRAMQAAKAK